MAFLTMNQNYYDRLARGLAFIDAHLSEPINLEQVAAECHFSAFHFHRIFSALMKETLNNYIARKRLEKSVHLLAYKRSLRITDIALECGFSSSANFAKAVKQYFGVSPSAIRSPSAHTTQSIGKILEKYGHAFDPKNLHINKETKPMSANFDVTIKQLSPLRLAKLNCSGGYRIEAICSTWDTLSQWHAEQKAQQPNAKKLAWCFDDPAITPLDKCRYDATIEISEEVEIATPFCEVTLPAGEYASLYVKGSPEDISKAQRVLFASWLPESGYEPDDLPLLEHYLNDMRQDGFIETELLLKVIPARQAH